MNDFIILIVAVLFTVIIELIVYYLYNIRRPKVILVIIAMNIATNLLVYLTPTITNAIFPQNAFLPLIALLIMEFVSIMVEDKILGAFEPPSKWLSSVVFMANGCSFILGTILLFGLFKVVILR